MSSRDDLRDARRRLDAFLRERFGPDLLDDVLGPIGVKEDAEKQENNRAS